MKQDNLRTWCMNGSTSSFQDEKLGSNPEVRIKFCKDTAIINRIIKTYHSYKQNTAYCGKRFDWLIYNDKEIVGLVGIGSPPMTISKSLMDYLGLNTNNLVEQKLHKRCAVNWRFTLMPYASKNTASQVISLMIKEAKRLWYREYKERLLFLFTYVHNREGILYKASGWDYVGLSSGEVFNNVPYGNRKFKLLRLAKTKSGKGLESEKKLIFIKGLHRNWRKAILKR